MFEQHLQLGMKQNAGQAITQQVVHSHFFQQAKSLGIYLHCTKLREVDTTPIVSAAVEAGKHLLPPAMQEVLTDYSVGNVKRC